MTKLEKHLRELRACEEAVKWARGYDSLATAWAECPRGDWLLWYASERGIDPKLLILAAAACARTALPYLTTDKICELRAIESTEAWTRGEATLQELLADAGAAYAPNPAARAVGHVTYAAASYAADATSASAALGASAAASAAADAAPARDAAHAKCANLVRGLIACPEEPA